ncbi:hypothetical protein BGZ95_004242 [Linnemannia exigua]|uniref:HCP-like protein n=1 Tax=Linnemannia exigua TaxID=604196 RepID=A0AAD4H933_9FUNG|nr:hypothetical protein BGZ95_004242 [Linnemannia exigua]
MFLDPLRIAAVPGETLDVVVRRQSSEKELSLESLHNALPDTPQESSSASQISNSNTVPTVRRNPAGGLIEEAMDAYRNNHNPAFGPRLRGPQAILDSTLSTPTSDSPPTHSTSSSQTPAPQESVTGTSKKIDEAIKNAKSGDMYAQFVLGHMYQFAQGVQQDLQSAVEWYLKAARQGHSGAQNRIGYMIQHGQGTPQDYTAAMNWFLKSAEQGNADASNNVGYMYQFGHGVPQDYLSAMDWTTRQPWNGTSKPLPKEMRPLRATSDGCINRVMASLRTIFKR